MRGTLRPIAFAISSVLRGTAQSPSGPRAVPSHPTPRAEQKRPSPKQMRRISLEAFKPVAIPKKSRVEELGRAMEKVETHNNDPKTLGMKYNNPCCLKYSKWQTVYGSIPGLNGFAKFPTYSLGKQAQLKLLRSAMTGRMVPYCRPEMTIEKFIRVYASSSPELEKINYVTRVEYSQSDNYQVIALKVFYPPTK